MTPNDKALVASCEPRRAALRPRALRAFAPLFKALGDETRLDILGLLAAAPGPLCVCDLEASFDLSQPTVSHHLRVLRESGWVTASRRGSWVHYALSDQATRRLGDFHAAMAAPTTAPPIVGDEQPVKIRRVSR